MYSRAEILRQTGMYEAAVTAMIADWEPRLCGEDAADMKDATRQLVAFDQHAQRTLGTGTRPSGR